METTRKTWPGSTGTYSTQTETDTLSPTTWTIWRSTIP